VSARLYRQCRAAGLIYLLGLICPALFLYLSFGLCPPSDLLIQFRSSISSRGAGLWVSYFLSIFFLGVLYISLAGGLSSAIPERNGSP
jgi:hypothetical protein